MNVIGLPLFITLKNIRHTHIKTEIIASKWLIKNRLLTLKAILRY